MAGERLEGHKVLLPSDTDLQEWNGQIVPVSPERTQLIDGQLFVETVAEGTVVQYLQNGVARALQFVLQATEKGWSLRLAAEAA